MGGASYTTALPNAFEGTAFWATRLVLGDYYQTYGAGSDGVETSVSKLLPIVKIDPHQPSQVRRILDSPSKQYFNNLGPGA